MRGVPEIAEGIDMAGEVEEQAPDAVHARLVELEVRPVIRVPLRGPAMTAKDQPISLHPTMRRLESSSAIFLKMSESVPPVAFQ